MAKHSRIIEEMQKTLQGLHSGGLIDERRMHEFEAFIGRTKFPRTMRTV